MFDLIALAAIAGAAWYFWPQITAFVKTHTASTTDAE
jgi:hypothetical protein